LERYDKKEKRLETRRSGRGMIQERRGKRKKKRGGGGAGGRNGGNSRRQNAFYLM
jgi:hypothetical protein